MKQISSIIEDNRVVREGRAEVFHAEGQTQAAEKLSSAAGIMSYPVSLQLGHLQP